MSKPPSKQVVINELEANTINEVLKEKILLMVRSSDVDYFDLDIMGKLQKRFEDILNYIRRKELET